MCPQFFVSGSSSLPKLSIWILPDADQRLDSLTLTLPHRTIRSFCPQLKLPRQMLRGNVFSAMLWILRVHLHYWIEFWLRDTGCIFTNTVCNTEFIQLFPKQCKFSLEADQNMIQVQPVGTGVWCTHTSCLIQRGGRLSLSQDKCQIMTMTMVTTIIQTHTDPHQQSALKLCCSGYRQVLSQLTQLTPWDFKHP